MLKKVISLGDILILILLVKSMRERHGRRIVFLYVYCLCLYGNIYGNFNMYYNIIYTNTIVNIYVNLDGNMW